MRTLSAHTRGIVFVEFLIAFIPFFLLFLGGVQLAFLAQAHAVVRHAALQAARTAVITIDDNPYYYDEEPRKSLPGKTKAKDGTTSERALQLLTGHAASPVSGAPESKGNRLKRIRNAAYVPLSAIGPTRQQVARWIPFATWANPKLNERSLFAATGDEPTWRVITGFGVYARAGAAITFPKGPGAAELLDGGHQFGDDENVTVRVSYLYPCQVPIVRAIICRSTLRMTGLSDAVSQTLQAVHDPSYATIKAAADQWKNKFPAQWRTFKAQLKELQHAEWPYVQMGVLAQLDEHFVVISHEASLPNHGAAYDYYQKSKTP